MPAASTRAPVASGRRPLVSVVVPVYNSADTLERAVGSVRRQMLASWEAILVDDASTDGSFDIARELAAEDPRIHVDRLSRNGGPAAARNRALEQARGRYMAFLDADDTWHPAKLRRQVEGMRQAGPGAVLSHTSWFLIGEDAVFLQRAPRQASHSQMLSRNLFGCSTVMVDTEVSGAFRFPDMKWRQDWAAWLELLRPKGTWALGLPRPLARIYKSREGHSWSKHRVGFHNWSVLRDQEEMPMPQALAHFGIYAAKGVSRQVFQKAARLVLRRNGRR